ncbi:MAG: hypothetical protein ACP5VP_00860 [Candidatus Limnocylindrales bacterium]
MQTSSVHPADSVVDVIRAQPDRPMADWRPASASEALAVADRIARYCAFSCNDGLDGCTEEQCAAWNLEHTATAYLASRWLDAQD